MVVEAVNRCASAASIEMLLVHQHGDLGAGTPLLHHDGREEDVACALGEEALHQWCERLGGHVVDVAIHLDVGLGVYAGFHFAEAEPKGVRH